MALSFTSVKDFFNTEKKFRTHLVDTDKHIQQVALTGADGADLSLGIAVSTHAVVTAASKNPTVVKASAGYMRGIYGTNLAGYPVKVCVHNQTTSPTAGSGVVFQRVVQAGGTLNESLPARGRFFSTGIAITIIKIAAAGDMAANASGQDTAANDAQFEVAYE